LVGFFLLFLFFFSHYCGSFFLLTLLALENFVSSLTVLDHVHHPVVVAQLHVVKSKQTIHASLGLVDVLLVKFNAFDERGLTEEIV
jgi:hypothetical protein